MGYPISNETLTYYKNFLKKASPVTPSFHVVLGSGFGQALSGLSPEWILKDQILFSDIPNMISTTVADHKGSFVVYYNEKLNRAIQFQTGRIHGYEGHSAQTVVTPVMLARLAQIESFILTNAAGGLLPHMHAGDAMVITDHVNLTGQNPLIGTNPTSPLTQLEIGPRFTDMGNCYHKAWQSQIRKILNQLGHNTTEGVYLGLLGPSFETHAEVRLFASWGLGAVGMSTVWEAIALKHSGAKIAGISLISNLGAGLSSQSLNHEDIVQTCRLSAHTIVQSIDRFIKEVLTNEKN